MEPPPGLGQRARLLRDAESPTTFISFGPWLSGDAVKNWRTAEGYHERVARLQEVLESFEPRTLELVARGVSVATTWGELLTGEEVAHVSLEPARAARLAPLPAGAPPASSRDALARRGVTALYTHQARGVGRGAARRARHRHDRDRERQDARVQPARARRDRARPEARALYLYPTKALAQDQARALAAFGVAGLRAGDLRRRHADRAALADPQAGRTRSSRTRTCSTSASCPHHDRWGDVLANLRYVVVDEAHVYRGVFGSHVGERPAPAAAARARLRRGAAVPARVGDDREPVRARAGAVGRRRDGRLRRRGARAPSGRSRSGTRRSSTRSSGSARARSARRRACIAELVERGLRTLCFAKSRKAAELIHRFTADRLGRATRPALAVPRRLHAGAAARDRAATRGGRAARRRRDRRARARDRRRAARLRRLGRLPGTVASLRQQWGRAGRRGHGLAVLVATEDALDQYFMREPEALLGRRVEAAISTTRTSASSTGTCCGGVRGADRRRRPRRCSATRRSSGRRAARAAAGRRRATSGQARDYPAARVVAPLGERGRRQRRRRRRREPCSASSSASAPTRPSTTAPCTSTSARPVSSSSSISTSRTALVEPFPGDWYTQAKKETETAIVEAAARASAARRGARVRPDLGLRAGGRATSGGRSRRRRRSTSSPLDLPATTFETEAIWYRPRAGAARGIERCRSCSGSLHAAEHALIALLPLWAMCDRWDIGGLSTNLHPQTGRPTVFVYDGHAGGVGIAERGFESSRAGWPTRRGCSTAARASAAARRASSRPKCGNLNEPLDKGGALELLRRMNARS